MCRLSLLILMIFSFCCAKAQQDVLYSNSKINLSAYNPSTVGNTEHLNSLFVRRNQWVGSDVSPKFNLVNIDMPFKIGNSKHGVGLLYMDEKRGMQKNARFNLNYAYKTKFLKGEISFGLSLDMMYNSFKGEFLLPLGDSHLFPQQKPETGGSALDVSEMTYDMGLGISYKYKNFDIGISAMHLLNPSLRLGNDAEYFYKKNYFVYINYICSLTDKIYLLPSCFLNSDLSTEQYSLSTKVCFSEKYCLGLAYRSKDSFTFLGEVRIFNGLKLGYAYDLDNSKYGKPSNGSHEFYLSYSCPIKIKPKRQVFKSVRFL